MRNPISGRREKYREKGSKDSPTLYLGQKNGRIKQMRWGGVACRVRGRLEQVEGVEGLRVLAEGFS